MSDGNCFEAKLSHGALLTAADREVLRDLSVEAREVDAHTDIIADGDNPTNVTVILDGFACRYKILPDGQRSIMAYLLPGDFCDLHVPILGHMDHAIATLSRCRVATIDHATVEHLLDQPRLRQAFWWAELVDHAISRQWIISLGRRTGDKMVAHLLCEILERLKLVGMGQNDGFLLPVTQTELGDTLGVSTVHINRVMAQLRDKRLIAQQRRHVQIPDVQALRNYCDFDPGYLHLG